jgi:sensor domain CHASE-containing protein
MFVPKQTTVTSRQQGWLLLAVVMIVLLVALGVVMLMSQAQLNLRSVRQEHQAIQEKVSQWPPLLDNRESVGAQ